MDVRCLTGLDKGMYDSVVCCHVLEVRSYTSRLFALRFFIAIAQGSFTSCAEEHAATSRARCKTIPLLLTMLTFAQEGSYFYAALWTQRHLYPHNATMSRSLIRNSRLPRI